ncbi:RNA polymerase sigma-70 factor (sigma-E family) [Kibdelosporangium banguiense]|uniref:RNA polymerase sigma-70 factor (Sigma-E family) n=1 Tax=Kibdelosporangium banguiense TaxID=1365924 RepID=A0ABS4TCC1_9PSEU|nr:SigE family RNA polymerase sigma factor [Kibdelosporangium banguiense]MBP2322075.1 RNA polymerase sigma-70 factor (sigma-E family) [Kibdelosporangium banguiense]
MRKPDEERFRAFAGKHAAALRRCAYLFCGDWHTAEDLTQTTLIKIYRAWPTVQKQESMQNYARKVLLNTWLDEKRRPWRRSELRVAAPPDHPDTGADPEAAQARSWAKDMTHRALLELPPRQRAALVLRYFDDLSVSETAAVLNCSEGTVKSQTARGLDTLRSVVENLSAGRPARRVVS